MMRAPALFAFMAIAAISASPATAQTRLTATTPAPESKAGSPARIMLSFDGALADDRSGATVTMTGMPGMADHPDMKMSGISVAIGPDRRSLVLTPARPLPAGEYRVDWYATGADRQRTTGKFSFSVM